MDSQLYKQKAEKYRMKYEQLKLSIQQGGLFELSNRQIMDLIELYDKTYNLYVLYRFRYDNTRPLLDFTDLSNLINKARINTKYEYSHYYIKDLLEKDDIDTLIRKQKNHVLFTLRQDTTKLLRNVLLLNTESVSNVQSYIDLLAKFQEDKEFAEIYGKCLQINGLVATGISFFESMGPGTELDIVRDESNHIINIIGNDYENTVRNKVSKQPNHLHDDPNDQLQRLFVSCFARISSELKKN